MKHLQSLPLLAALLSSAFFHSSASAEAPKLSPADVEFFETKIRPLFAKHCYKCHSARSKPIKGGLLLDSHSGGAKGGDSGAVIVPGKPQKSLLIAAVKYQSFEMPPAGKLPAAEIALLVKWVESGAPWPKDRAATSEKEKTYGWKQISRQHWAWRPVGNPPPPDVSDSAWPANEIDRFILAKHEANNMSPAQPADRRTLIRRVYVDLIGFLPSPEEVDSFVHTKSENAYPRLIDRLLASEHYGERWGRHWLDVARYSDGFGGFLDSAGLPNAWRYRDWVVQALNDDLPYDEFVRLQIAGDLIDGGRNATATGFLSLGPTYKSDGGDPDSIAQAKSETLDDRIDTLSRGFLGLTVACARCHDHKFDPIPTLDYYSLAGVFNNTRNADHPLAPQAVVDRYTKAQTAINGFNQQITKTQNAAKKSKRDLTDGEKQQIASWQKQLDQLKKTAPPKYATAHALADSGRGDMKVALRGNLRKPGPVAPRRFLRLIAGANPVRFERGSGRLDLADAVANADNPLTSRVIVNRIWMHHFGKALVRSPSNFGTLGQKPTHPELLDWLATHLIDSGWSIKQLHRTIMFSATYKMSSRYNAASFNLDGDNKLVWRMNPRRMDVEAWRDSLLSATGELDRQLGGAPIEDLAGSKRRTLYAKTSRNGDRFRSDEFLRLFDFPLPRATIARRPVSIVPQQFLFMMNSQFMVNRAKALVARLNREAKDDGERIEQAYLLLYSRKPNSEEIALGMEYLAGVENADAEKTAAKTQQTPAKPNTPTTQVAGKPRSRLSRWEQYAQVLLSANEFMSVR